MDERDAAILRHEVDPLLRGDLTLRQGDTPEDRRLLLRLAQAGGSRNAPASVWLHRCRAWRRASKLPKLVLEAGERKRLRVLFDDGWVLW